MGGNAFDWHMDYNKAQAATCTTCGVSNDKSSYWIPTVYFRAANGSYISVQQVGGVTVYYQQRIGWAEIAAGKTIQPFPPGLRMLAGDPDRRTYNSSINEDRAIEYDCIPANAQQGNASTGGFPNHTSLGGLQIHVHFPSCWDGKNIDSPDHRSHVSYPSMMDNGVCDDAHPLRIMALLYETTWAVDHFDALRKPGDRPFVLSTGDSTGYGWHADFLNRWDTDLLRAAIADNTTCGDSAGGDINKCAPFKPYMLSAEQQNACPAIPNKIDEQVDGILSALPGQQQSPTMAIDIAAPSANITGRRLRRLC